MEGRGGLRSAFLGRKGRILADWGGRSLFLKETGYPGARKGKQNYNTYHRHFSNSRHYIHGTEFLYHILVILQFFFLPF